MSILSALAATTPVPKARVEETIKAILATAKDKKEKGSRSERIADTLLANHALLNDAEKYAKASVDSMKEAEYIADQKAQFAKFAASAHGEKAPTPPSDQELKKRFSQSRAARLATLGRIEFELGKTPAALKALSEAHAADRSLPGAEGTLGEIAVQKGDYAKALEYLVSARLAGQAAPTTVAALATAFSKTHDGATAGLDAYLDSEYRKRFPDPLHLDAYRPNDKRSDRLVLAEVFTGAGCPPCVGADLAFDAAMERYARKDVAIVMYHQHVPRPDPMTNNDTTARFKYYAIGGVPTYFIDGATVKYNGAGRDGTKGVWEHIQSPIEKDLDTAAEARIAVKASASGNAVKVSASVDRVKSESKDLKVQVLLLEKEITYSGEMASDSTLWWFVPWAVKRMTDSRSIPHRPRPSNRIGISTGSAPASKRSSTATRPKGTAAVPSNSSRRNTRSIAPIWPSPSLCKTSRPSTSCKPHLST
ncbi:MAG: hypothetical protein WDO73_27960 [Ignavibacteriota bacterium]